MGSDIARRTYDEGRQYRRVVAQQGRVVIEADLNEAQEISTEETRKEALDFVGPAGTPDDGYKLSFPADPPQYRDFFIGPGTMYVGGMRVSLPSPGFWFSQQTEWLDGIPPLPDAPQEMVLLLLSEREVSAVEDRHLREVALGGPDTAQRTRLLQRFLRFGIPEAYDCEGSLAHVSSDMAQSGMYFDPKTMRLESKCTLAAAFIPPSPPPDACSPVAQAGYLGAENQLIRIQIHSGNTLLWSYDNASSLYRVAEVSIDQSNGKSVLKLASSPVDEHHHPRIGQWVEVLGVAAYLDDENYVASLTGEVAPVTAAYDPVERTVTIGTALPLGYADAPSIQALFVRVWESQITFTPGVATPIGDTGLQVTLAAEGDVFVPGHYWNIALRPGAPTKIFPERYQQGPQPPDGPRHWLCPLGIVGWDDGGGHVRHDCRQPFDNLVELSRRLGGCCTVVVKPEDVNGGAGLQALIDSYKPALHDGPVTICLLPGTYTLNAPLRFDEHYAGLTIESCREGAAEIKAKNGAPASMQAFRDGLIVLTGPAAPNAPGLTLRGLHLTLPNVELMVADGTFSPLYFFCKTNNSTGTLRVAIGIRLVETARATITGCTFDFDSVYGGSDDYILAIGLFGGGNVTELEVCENHFLATYPVSGTYRKFFYGCVHTSSTQIDYHPELPGASPTSDVSTLVAVLDGAVFRGNLFSKLTAGLLLNADNRRITIDSNRAIACNAGFWLLRATAAMRPDHDLDAISISAASLVDPATTSVAVRSLLDNLRDEALFKVGGAMARSYPLPSGVSAPPAITISSTLPTTWLQDMLVVAETVTLNAVQEGTLILDVARNEVISGTGSVSLLVWAAPTDPDDSEVIMGMNRLSVETRIATALLIDVDRCTANGNLLRCQGTALSLAILPTSGEQQRVAVTGNVFKAPSVLPKRPTPGAGIPAVPWQFFNYEEA